MGRRGTHVDRAAPKAYRVAPKAECAFGVLAVRVDGSPGGRRLSGRLDWSVEIRRLRVAAAGGPGCATGVWVGVRGWVCDGGVWTLGRPLRGAQMRVLRKPICELAENV